MSGTPRRTTGSAIDSLARPRRVRLIRASAGSGKTFQLSSRFIELLRTTPVDQILAVTFTRKAAGEILERILLRLAEAATDDKSLALLAEYVGEPPLTREECLRLLTTVTRNLHRLRIGTLDGFFSRMATSFALELALPQGWEMADDDELDAIRIAAIDAVLRETSFDAARRLVHLLGKGESQRSIRDLVLQTVTNLDGVFRQSSADAWKQLPEGVLLPDDEQQRLFAELAAFDLSNDSRMAKARSGDVEQARTGDWVKFLSGGLAGKVAADDPLYYKKPLPGPLVELYRLLVKHARSHILTVWAHQNAGAREVLELVHRARQSLIEESGRLGFQDVTDALTQGLSGVAGASLVHRLDAEIGHLLLDEFQDTSLQQWGILKAIADDVGRRPDGTVFSVGDPKQAIYGWRGGDPVVFDLLVRSFPDLAEDSLDCSRRSSPVVIETVNRIFQGLSRHDHLELDEDAVAEWSRSFPPHSTAKTDAPGRACLETCAIPGELQTPDEACSSLAADRVAEYLEHAPWASIGILTRANAMIPILMHELSQRGISASEEGGASLKGAAGVQIILSALRFADHPSDSVSQFHVAHSPLGELLEMPASSRSRGADAVAARIRADLLDRGYETVISEWAARLKPLCDLREWNRLRQLVVMAAEYGPRASLRPADFVARVETVKVEDPSEGNVRVMTIHKSKGLEFDIVVLPDLDWAWWMIPTHVSRTATPGEPCDAVMLYRSRDLAELLPKPLQSAYDTDRRRQLDGGLCCLYVAVTRAVHALHMIVAPKPDAKNFPKTAAGLLRASLAASPAAPGSTILYEAGDREWWSDPRRLPKAVPARPARPSLSPPPPIALAPSTDGRRRGRATAAPSRGKDAATALATSFLDDVRSGATQRGTLWHAWCQAIGWLDEGPLTRAKLLSIGRKLCPVERDCETALDQFERAIQQPAIARLLSHAEYRPPRNLALAEEFLRRLDGPALEVSCFAERRFTIVDGERHVSGAIDRIVLLKEKGQVVAAEIIDFKTDRSGENSPLREAYLDQLDGYARAVSKAYQLDRSRISGKLVWLATGAVESVNVSQPRPRTTLF